MRTGRVRLGWMPAQAMYKDNFPIGIPIPIISDTAKGYTIESKISETKDSRSVCDDSYLKVIRWISLKNLIDMSFIFQADM